MKKRKAKLSSKDKYDTLSITMELERPLLYNEEENLKKQENKKKEENSRKFKKGIYALLVVVVLFVAGFFIWLSNGYKLETESLSYLESDSTVEVTTEDKNIYFTPKNIDTNKGFILYPGERVNASSYAKICKKVASLGYKVIAVDMPFNYPSLGVNEASQIMNVNTEIEKWVIGGDSLGGTAACKFASKNGKVDGIVLISSYPTNDINNSGIDVLSISGSKDDVIDYKKMINSKHKLPKDTIYVEIEGANHSQFGSYGKYSGDGEALITEDEQINITVNNIATFLNSIK